MSSRLYFDIKRSFEQVLIISVSHLDDDQTELTLQQEQEALADAVGRVSSLEHTNPRKTNSDTEHDTSL